MEIAENIEELGGSSKNWCFTCFDIHVVPEVMFEGDYQYLVYQYEKCPKSKRMHIQGYIVFKAKTRRSTCKRYHREIHWETRKGSHSEAKGYCLKEETRIEGPYHYGDDTDIPEGQGSRTDLKKCKSRLDEGCTVMDLADDHFSDVIRYHKGFQLYADYVQSKKIKLEIESKYTSLILRDWQKDLLEDLKIQDDRKIKWIQDSVGGQGKSTMAQYLENTQNAFVCKGGKYMDVAYEYNFQKLIVFDLSRSYEASKDVYRLIEDFKDGRVTSGKYDSRTKRQINVKVVVFANWAPDKDTLSQDRWDIEEI